METNYEYLDDLSDAQLESWIIDTEPDEGRPTIYHAVRVEHAIETAANALTNLLYGITNSDTVAYLPNCRYHLDYEHLNPMPLGGIMDALGEPADPQAPPANLASLVESVRPPYPHPLSNYDGDSNFTWDYWHNQSRWSLDSIYDSWYYEPPLEFRFYLDRRARANTSRTKTRPWWKQYNPRSPHPLPPNRHKYPKTTGDGDLAALGAFSLLESLIEGAEAIQKTTESGTIDKDFLVSSWFQIDFDKATEMRQKTDTCKAQATADIKEAVRWIYEVTKPNSPANMQADWGMDARRGRRLVDREHKLCTWEDADKLITQSIGLLLLHKWGKTIRSQAHTEASPIGRYRDGQPLPSPYEQGDTPEGVGHPEGTPWIQDIKSQEQFCNTCWYSLKCRAVRSMAVGRETLTRFILPKQTF